MGRLFEGKLFSTTGFTMEERAKMTALIEAEAGLVMGELNVQCDFLICKCATGVRRRPPSLRAKSPHRRLRACAPPAPLLRF